MGDISKIKRDCGWEPEIPIEKTLDDTLNYWREKYAAQRQRGHKIQAEFNKIFMKT